ncbi:MAG: hypothetical protein ACE5GO_09700, partial [Anaerolineales bacterium]
IYLLQDVKRYPVPSLETLAAMGGDLLDVSLVTPDCMNHFPLADNPLPALTRSEDELNHPQVSAALWANGFLWVANETGLLTRWDTNAGVYREYRLPDEPTIRALAGDGSTLYAGTETGQIWQLTAETGEIQLVNGELNWISALALG